MAIKFNVGVVGLGYVGTAIKYAYEIQELQDRLFTYDIKDAKNPTCGTLQELTEQADLIYVAVPTPMKSNGECDTSIVEHVTDEICQSIVRKIVVIKSTVTPGTTEKLQARHPTHNIFFCPEFLTEANYLEDYLNQDVMLLGIPKNSYRTLGEAVLQEQLSVSKVKYSNVVDATTAEFYKYIANIFLATKVSFANEMETIAKEIGVNWEHIVNVVANDRRLGKSHWNVPGPDGHRGFGGTCFPKDINALIAHAQSLDIQTPLLKAVWKRNVLVDRPERDWEELKGRAVSE